jgi:hypothetical protein
MSLTNSSRHMGHLSIMVCSCNPILAVGKSYCGGAALSAQRSACSERTIVHTPRMSVCHNEEGSEGGPKVEELQNSNPDSRYAERIGDTHAGDVGVKLFTRQTKTTSALVRQTDVTGARGGVILEICHGPSY